MKQPAHISPFDQIKQTTEDGVECWSARDLAKVLGYSRFGKFVNVIEKAVVACKNSGHNPDEHFIRSKVKAAIGSGASRGVDTVLLSRYACYLTIQNADPQKEIVALGQTYFAIQTRAQELADSEQLLEDERRLLLRDEIRRHNLKLADAAKNAGVVEPLDYAIFQNHGYRGLYNGLDQAGIHYRKGLKKSQKILDHMGSSELAANFFRVTQAEDKLRREGTTGKDEANKAHFEVGAKVRQTIKELGGAMPEDMPVAESINKLESRRKRGELTPPALEDLLEESGQGDE